MADEQENGAEGMGHVRVVVVLYLLVIVAGLALYAVVGLTHN